MCGARLEAQVLLQRDEPILTMRLKTAGWSSVATVPGNAQGFRKRMLVHIQSGDAQAAVANIDTEISVRQLTTSVAGGLYDSRCRLSSSPMR